MNWAQICEDKALAGLPHRIESDRWGNQGEIAALLRQKMSGRLRMPECPVLTDEGVKAADVVWVSHERRASRQNDPVYLIAPEICVEVLSPSNIEGELQERKGLFFQKGAIEVCFCGLEGEICFFDPGGQITRSHLCPEFPKQVVIG